ncbi:HAD-IA family hydrolase [Paenibacillus sp. N3/727]|uniref:HAD-IA family hydrolase n=1 Tax=Paenibacillus sp. N3/727 TaxID=2925845 RepID=UPI001F532AF7|nr:HAD-IA family hydrolase [Paenibacillus sp. N3/727]UNK20573.1 HAD-IA family hydrolase [Paenibacillus sp. N3/727]
MPPEHIINPISVLDEYLNTHHIHTFFFVGPDTFQSQMKTRTSSYETPEAVILCDFEYIETDYKLLNRIYHYLIQGSVLITTSYSEYYLSDGVRKLDTGSFTRMFEQVSRQKAAVLGKPSRTIYETAVKQLGCLPSEIISVGDDILTDVPGAKEAGLKPVLVRTGKYRPEDELGSDDCVVVNDLYEFIARIENATLSI